MYMVKAFSDYVWGEGSEKQTGLQEVEPQWKLNTADVDDEWTLVGDEQALPLTLKVADSSSENEDGEFQEPHFLSNFFFHVVVVPS